VDVGRWCRELAFAAFTALCGQCTFVPVFYCEQRTHYRVRSSNGQTRSYGRSNSRRLDAVKNNIAFELIKKPNAMQAMLKMKKLDIAELERAAES
jgi:hypothetical protein